MYAEQRVDRSRITIGTYTLFRGALTPMRGKFWGWTRCAARGLTVAVSVRVTVAEVGPPFVPAVFRVKPVDTWLFALCSIILWRKANLSRLAKRCEPPVPSRSRSRRPVVVLPALKEPLYFGSVGGGTGLAEPPRPSREPLEVYA